jgi:hypothetical protein
MAASPPAPSVALTPCRQCGTPTPNPQFCSRSCATRFNNLRCPKRRLEGRCAVCQCPVPRRNRYCPAHRTNRGLGPAEWAQALRSGSAHIHHWGHRVRLDARRRYYVARPYRCVCCGYERHIDVCHKRAVATFPPNTALDIVNSLDNLVGLCPNCHWEFDHGLLQL